MKIAKRIFLFIAVNLLVITTISIALNVLGIRPYLTQSGINFTQLILFCLAWGFGGALISLALSRVMAKWMSGVELITPDTPDARLRALYQRVQLYSQKAGLAVMPQVGVYEDPTINAFATGPTRNRSLVAVSTGLLENLNSAETDGVLAHEVAHIANGDMVTMTLVTGVVNAFSLFLSRVIAFALAQGVREETRPMVNMVTTIALDIVFSILGTIVVAFYSRRREFRADAGGAQLAGREKMIAALAALKQNEMLPEPEERSAVAALQISGRTNVWLRLFSTHPPLEVRIARLQQ